MLTYYIHTYGCQMNYSDSERMETYLQALGYTPVKDEQTADILIFNTCSVKQKAEDKVFGEIKKVRKYKKKNPDFMLIVTGCMIRKSSSRYSTERDKLFNRMRELDIALRIEELPRLASLIREINPDARIKEIPEEKLEDYFNITPSYTSPAQAFISISTGCDKFCTYCIVPYSRGREKSRTIQDILEEAKKLVTEGCKEITLLGQTVDSYGISAHDKKYETFKDLPKNKLPFVHLLEELNKLSEKGLKRLRFTSPHPRDMSDELIDAIANLETLMPYLHLPVQAGHNETLKRMNRPYTIERYKEVITQLRTRIPGIAISTDIIVGFCGETDEEFKTTYDFFKEIGFDHAYLSPYSERPGTYAAKNLTDDIPVKTKKERWVKLNQLLKETSEFRLKNFIGKTVNVLVEQQKGTHCIGRSEHYKTVEFESDRKLLGEIVPVKITNSLTWVLLGKLV